MLRVAAILSLPALGLLLLGLAATRRGARTRRERLGFSLGLSLGGVLSIIVAGVQVGVHAALWMIGLYALLQLGAWSTSALVAGTLSGSGRVGLSFVGSGVASTAAMVFFAAVSRLLPEDLETGLVYVGAIAMLLSGPVAAIVLFRRWTAGPDRMVRS